MTNTNPTNPVTELSDQDILNNFRKQWNELCAQTPIDSGEVRRLGLLIKDAEKRIEAAAKKAAAAEQSALDEELEGAIGIAKDELKKQFRAELQRRDYYYVTANERFWLKTAHNDWIPVSERGLIRDIKGITAPAERTMFYELMMEDARWFDRCTYTFDKVPDDTLNMLIPDFVMPVSEEPHWFFDMLIRSIGGEREENYDHIEKLILTKYLHPESVTVPALLLQDEGGTGKNLFAARLLPAIFGEHGVGTNLRVEHVAGKFNAIAQGKAVWFINEASRGSYSHSALKAIVGSETYAIENKGVNPIMGPMTAWIIMSTQDVDGAVLLEGGGADRRWSVVRGGRELAHIVAEKLGVGFEEAKAWIEATGKHILSDRKEAGKWMNALVARHGDVRVSQGLHGEDYREIRGIQQTIETTLFATVFGDEHFDRIRCSTLYEMYCHFAKGSQRTPIARGKFHALAEKWIKNNRPDLNGREAANVAIDGKRSKVEFYSRDKSNGTLPGDNEAAYRRVDDAGHKGWRVAI